MKKISAKQEKEFERRRKLKAKLMELAPTDNMGRKLCPQCGQLPDLKDGRGELHLCHEKPLSLGGRTSFKNCYLGCRRDHFGEDGHRQEDMPRSQTVDKPPMMSGYHHGQAISKEQQTGIKRKGRLL